MKQNTLRTFFSSLFLLIFLMATPSWADAPVQEREPPVIQRETVPYYPMDDSYLASTENGEAPSKVTFGTQMIEVLLMLGLILLLLLFSAWFIRRMMQTRTNTLNKINDIKILEQRALSQKAVVYLLEISGKKLVLGESPAGLHYFTELSEERVVRPSDSDLQHSFEEVMQRKIQKERV